METNNKQEFEQVSQKLREIKVTTKSKEDDFTVEYEVASIFDIIKNDKYQQIENEINDIEDESLNEIDNLTKRIDDLNKEINRLTNNADKTDYILSVASGILCGLLDSFFVGEFSIENANKWGTEKIVKFVKEVAENMNQKNMDLYDSVSYLEDEFKIPSDAVYNVFGGATQHHLRDFAHHPTIVGLVFSILTQVTGKAYGIGQDGFFKIVPVDNDFIGQNFTSKISLGLITWFFHLVSDVAGSTSSLRMDSPGTGLPGPILSTLFEMSKIPFFNKSGKTDFTMWITKLWNGTLPGLKERRIHFDMRTELGVWRELGKQAIPVIINECFVRGFYFIRRLANNLKENPVHSLSDFINLDWQQILPFKNRTVARMITIASGTFTIVDLADAAIHSALQGGTPADPKFWASFVLRVNFVGVGRFAIALFTDIRMGVQRQKCIKKRNDAIIFRELEKNVVIQCELAKTQIALTKMYELIQYTVDNTEKTLLKIEDEENDSFDLVTKAAERRKKMINNI